MALQYSSNIYLGRLDLVESTTGTAPLLKIYSGSPTANCADCLPLAADAAETTLTLVTLQEWLTEQQQITKEQQ